VATELFPIISTTDLERSLRFYRDLLGGTVSFEYPGPNGAIAYAGVELGSSQIGIGSDSAAAGGGPISLWLYVEDCDGMVARLADAGVEILQEPRDEPWGERVARVADPDGIQVHVASRGAAPGD
jgi:lactoylglutathione lyase